MKKRLPHLLKSLDDLQSGLWAHELVHCDIKPQNLVIQNGKLKLIDADTLCKQGEPRTVATIGQNISDEEFALGRQPCDEATDAFGFY